MADMRARVIRKPMTCAQSFFLGQNRKGGADKSTCKERQQQGKPKTTIYHYDAEPASMQPFHCTALCRAKPSSECPRHSRQLQCREQRKTQSSPQRLTCRTPFAATAPTHTSCRAYAHATPTQMRPTWDNAGRQAPNNSRGVLVRDDTQKMPCIKHKPTSSLCQVKVQLGHDNDARDVSANFDPLPTDFLRQTTPPTNDC
jgi:hypothetical protein